MYRVFKQRLQRKKKMIQYSFIIFKEISHIILDKNYVISQSLKSLFQDDTQTENKM